MATHKLAALLGLLTIAAASSPAQGDLRAGECIRETEAAFPGDAQGEIWTVRIIDAWTGLPIPGAVVHVPSHRQGGATSEDLFNLCSGTADADGWVRLGYKEVEGYDDYVVADAPGYAPNEYCLPGEVECPLIPGKDVPIVVLDYIGRPVVGARVALNLGCGHIPDQRQCTTGVGGRGILRSIDPSHRDSHDIWIESPGLHRGTHRLSVTWRPGSPPVQIHAPPGIIVEGRVLGADGKPVCGARVGPREWTRPWMHTDADGRFRLVGVSAWDVIDVLLSDEAEQPAAWFHAPPEGTLRTITIGAPDAGASLAVSVRGPANEPAAGVRVVLLRTTDGLTVTEMADATGRVVFSVPPGHYEVLVDGELGTWATARATTDVKEGEDASVLVEVARNPTIRVDASRVRELRIGLTTERQFRALEPEVIDGRDVPIPPSERAAFRISGEEGGSELLVSFVAVPPPGPLREVPLVLKWVPETRLTARLIGPDGNPVLGTLQVKREPTFSLLEGTTKSEATIQLSCTTHHCGTLDWIAVPVDSGLGKVHGTVTLPEQGGVVDLGVLKALPAPASSLRVVIPPVLDDIRSSIALSFRRATCISWTAVNSEGNLPVNLPWLTPGESFVLSAEAADVLPVAFRIQGPPPWVVRWPANSLRLHLSDQAGQPVPEARALLDGTLLGTVSDAEGLLMIRGLSAGAHKVIITAAGHVSQVLTIFVQEGDARDLSLRLRRRT